MSEATKSLKSRKHRLASSFIQLKVLNDNGHSNGEAYSFEGKLHAAGHYPLKPLKTEILQVNIGKMCNQTCRHCHVDAGPDRKEIMTREVMQQCIDAVKNSDFNTVDLTGGAPEMNPDFRWFVEKLDKAGVNIIVRCNLTIILANPRYYDLPEFYKTHNVVIISSLPHYSARRTDAQRGEGVFAKSIQALKMLNEVGYGMDGSGLELHLVYNPSGAYLPPSQESLKKDFKRRLKSDFDIEFNDLYAITNMPISRFLDYLIQSGNYDAYTDKLLEAFNPLAIDGLMCRNTVSVGWDGYLYDCDFNQMLDLKIGDKAPLHISEFDEEMMLSRTIITNQHCFGCTAGSGSSCGGEIA